MQHPNDQPLGATGSGQSSIVIELGSRFSADTVAEVLGLEDLFVSDEAAGPSGDLSCTMSMNLASESKSMNSRPLSIACLFHHT
jgi:hypothetical protein